MPILFAAPGGGVLFLLLSTFWVFSFGYFGAYAAHSLLVVVEQTAAGFDRVCWPQEGFLDWCWKGVYLTGLVLMLLLPAALLVPWLGFNALPGALPGLGLVLLMILWLVFPVSLLSSMSGPSRLMVVRWIVLKRLAGCWRPLLVFYALAAVLLAGCAGSVYFALLGWEEVRLSLLATAPSMVEVFEIVLLVVGVPVTGMLGSTTLLLYGRLLGRLAWMLQVNQPAEKEEEPSAEPETEDVETAAVAGVSDPGHREEPSPGAVAGVSDPGHREETASGTYALSEEPPPPPEDPPFRWEPGRIPPLPPPRNRWRDRPDVRPVEPDEREEKPEPVAQPRVAALFEPKVLLFPWYRTSLRAWLWLAFGATCLGLLLRLQLAYL